MKGREGERKFHVLPTFTGNSKGKRRGRGVKGRGSEGKGSGIEGEGSGGEGVMCCQPLQVTVMGRGSEGKGVTKGRGREGREEKEERVLKGRGRCYVLPTFTGNSEGKVRGSKGKGI